MTDTPRLCKRPPVAYGPTHHMDTGCGEVSISINYIEPFGLKIPWEIFAHMGKAGTCVSAWSNTSTILTSYMLQSGWSLETVGDIFIGQHCPNPEYVKGVKITSCLDAIGRAIIAEHERIKTLPEYWDGIK